MLAAELIVHGAEFGDLHLLRAGSSFMGVALRDQALDGGGQRGGLAHLRLGLAKRRGVGLTLILRRLDSLFGKECGVDRSGALERLDHINSPYYVTRTREQ